MCKFATPKIRCRLFSEGEEEGRRKFILPIYYCSKAGTLRLKLKQKIEIEKAMRFDHGLS